MQIICGRKFKLSRISYSYHKFSSEFFIKVVNKVLHEWYNRKSFTTNFNKTPQLQKFATMNNVHYYATIYGIII